MKVDPSTLPADHPSRNAPLSKVGGEYRYKSKDSPNWRGVASMKIGDYSYNALASVRENPWLEFSEWRVEI
jgi:hypothetical protein